MECRHGTSRADAQGPLGLGLERSVLARRQQGGVRNRRRHGGGMECRNWTSRAEARTLLEAGLEYSVLARRQQGGLTESSCNAWRYTRCRYSSTAEQMSMLKEESMEMPYKQHQQTVTRM